MEPVTVLLYGADGSTRTLKGLRSLSVSADRDSPADSLELEAMGERLMEEPVRAEVRLGERLIFAGGVDEVRQRITAGGNRMSLSARSPGALLLDNEALPGTHFGVRFEDIWRRYGAPYGVFRNGLGKNPYLARFTVPKGLCEWEVLCDFCRLTLGQEPRLSRDLVLTLFGGTARTLTIGTGAGDLHWLSMEHRNNRAAVLSKICLRDENGYYTSQVVNPEAEALQIRRKRYCIPGSQYALRPADDAERRLRKAMEAKEQVVLHLAGWPVCEPGDRVLLRESLPHRGPWQIAERTYSLDRKGPVTRLILKKEED